MKKAGGGKAKGALFERLVCKDLSLWVSKGKRDDLFWRSAMSGGRATLKARKGGVSNQAGDITAVHSDGHVLTDYWFIECKFVKDYRIDLFVLQLGGRLKQFWEVAVREAKRHDRTPMIIAKQNRGMTIVVIPESERVKFGWARASLLATVIDETTHACILSYDKMIAEKTEFRTKESAPETRVRLVERVRLK